MSNDALYLRHIRQALDRILEYTNEGKEAFMDCTMAQDAVMRNFESSEKPQNA